MPLAALKWSWTRVLRGALVIACCLAALGPKQAGAVTFNRPGQVMLELGGLGVGASNPTVRGMFSADRFSFGVSLAFTRFTLAHPAAEDLGSLGLAGSVSYHPFSSSPVGPYVGGELGVLNMFEPLGATILDTSRLLVGSRFSLFGMLLGGAFGLRLATPAASHWATAPEGTLTATPFAEVTVGVPL